MSDSAISFLHRHEFLIRRLHSLAGLVPVGAFMCVHLLVNASILESPAKFQANVFQIHSLGKLLVPIEWAFIFLPILFHAVLGVVIIAGGLPNHGSYPYGANIRYTLQRVTGMIAFVFIMYHVLHMHGWFHADWWVESVAEPLGGAKFRAYNAGSSAGAALQNPWITAAYAVGVLASVYHLANGIWTMGITWGVWTSPRSQQWALRVCALFGIGLGIVGLGALGGMRAVGSGEMYQQAREAEDKIYAVKVASGEVHPDSHKRTIDETTEAPPFDSSEDSVAPAFDAPREQPAEALDSKSADSEPADSKLPEGLVPTDAP